jgi:glycolate oxidase FAD binding subunit
MKPKTIAEVQEIVRTPKRLVPQGGGSKPALINWLGEVERVELSELSGMLQYQPDEFTFTAQAGTPLAEVEEALESHGQFMPFDPPFVGSGGTLGGTVASGLSGPGRYRYGGVGDFLLGVQFVDGQGQALRGGGKVVKNAAGFDLPKLMVGSLGQYGILVELTFKVFPRPEAYNTLCIDYESVSEALPALIHLSKTPLEIFALDLWLEESRALLLVRIGGAPATFPRRRERLLEVIDRQAGRVLEGEVENDTWREMTEFIWIPEGCSLVKVPLTPKRVMELDVKLAEVGALRRYSVGANVAWISWPGAIEDLDALLQDQSLSGLVISGSSKRPRIGIRRGDIFAERIKKAIDPHGRWVEA